jgi:hypothetical protein
LKTAMYTPLHIGLEDITDSLNKFSLINEVKI